MYDTFTPITAQFSEKVFNEGPSSHDVVFWQIVRDYQYPKNNFLRFNNTTDGYLNEQCAFDVDQKTISCEDITKSTDKEKATEQKIFIESKKDEIFSIVEEIDQATKKLQDQYPLIEQFNAYVGTNIAYPSGLPQPFGNEQEQKFCYRFQPEDLPPQDPLYIASLTALGECKEGDNCQPRQDPNCSNYSPFS